MLKKLRALGPGALAFLFAGALLAFFTLVRVVLAAMSWALLAHRPGTFLAIAWTGLRFDVFMAAAFAFPLALWAAVLPERWLHAKWHRGLLRVKYFAFLFYFLFLSVVEIAFFEEFNARFNYIAVDYLLFPTEVAGNIWQSYPVAWIVCGVGLVAALVFWLTRRAFDALFETAVPLRTRWTLALAWLLACTGLWFTVGMKSMEISENRVENEVAGNSYYTFFYALYSNDLDYAQYYQTMDPVRATDLVKRTLAESEAEFTGSTQNPLERDLQEDGALGEPNFVVILEESFGTPFTGVLGHNPENLTPNFDRLAAGGVLFRNFYATGNRTVRGLEAILCSFPPVPGTSILKRDRSRGIFTLADILRDAGYETLFVYGGRGIFDNMKPFMLENGFQRFIEQSDFKSPTFTTAWGVCDEDIFHRALEEFDALDRQGKRFFGTVLTVSNHKPYTYPEGRIDRDPKKKWRSNAVKYADWALGDFFERAKDRPFFKKTIFVVIGDHGARVYGADFIPIASYEVPFVIYAPGLVKPGTVDVLGSSLDVAPTLLGLTDLHYRTVFFGRDMFDLKPEDGYALMQHDRVVGILQGDRMALLGPLRAGQVYRYDRAAHAFAPVPKPGLEEVQLVHKAVAIYQTAYSFYRSRLYHLMPTAKPMRPHYGRPARRPRMDEPPSKNVE